MTELDNVGFCVCLNVLKANWGFNMGVCSSFKSYIHVKSLESFISVIDFIDRLLIVLVVACGVRAVQLFLSVKPKKAGDIFDSAVMYNSHFNNSASGILKFASSVAGFEVIRDAFVHNAAFNLDIKTTIELVDSGLLDQCFYVEEILFELSVWCKCPAEIESVIAAIIRRRSKVSYVKVLNQVTRPPLENGASAVHHVLRIMHKNGYDFHGGSPVAPETFFCPNPSPGLISDLIEWGVSVERPTEHGLSEMAAHINSEIDEGERRIAERDAANITQALADAGLTQDDAPKPKRRM
ncbi:TPA: hypothetical protein UN036_000423 [Stenotrophomonas maltophilia]|nr:hypothetical protein [Stenotrophomonas maltophilia]